MNSNDDLQPNFRPDGTGTADTDIVHATQGGRRLAATVIFSMIVLSLCIAGWMLTKSHLHLAIGMSPSPRAIAGIQYGFSALAFLVAVLAIFLTITGLRTVRRRRSPLPGALVWRDTPVIRGDRARTIGLAYMAAGIVSFVAGIALAVYIWQVLQKVADANVIVLRPGVTILQQPTVIPK